MLTAGTFDMLPPLAVTCLGQADRVGPRSRGALADHPAPPWCRTRSWCTLLGVQTVRLSPYSNHYSRVGQALRIATRALRIETAGLAMTAHVTGDARDPA